MLLLPSQNSSGNVVLPVREEIAGVVANESIIWLLRYQVLPFRSAIDFLRIKDDIPIYSPSSAFETLPIFGVSN